MIDNIYFSIVTFQNCVGVTVPATGDALLISDPIQAKLSCAQTVK